MYDLLRSVYSATSKKGVSSVLKQMRLEKGKIVGTNGSVTIGAEIKELAHLDVTVPAEQFVKAISIAELSKLRTKVTPTGKLSIIAGKFKAMIPTTPNDAFPGVEMNGEFVECKGLIEALKAVEPFMGDDAIRLWSNGVLLTNEYAYATNNISIVRYKVDMKIPNTILPRGAVAELLRIGKEPIGIVHSEKSISFIMEDDVWLHAATINAEWPSIDKFFVGIDNLPPIHDELLVAVEAVAPFCPDLHLPKIYFSEEGVSTHEGEMSSSYEIEGLPTGCFHADVLKNLLPSIDNIDLSLYPKPCKFDGKNGKMQGVLMGMIQ